MFSHQCVAHMFQCCSFSLRLISREECAEVSERACVALSHDCHLWTGTQRRSLNSLRFTLLVSFCVGISML